MFGWGGGGKWCGACDYVVLRDRNVSGARCRRRAAVREGQLTKLTCHLGYLAKGFCARQAKGGTFLWLGAAGNAPNFFSKKSSAKMPSGRQQLADHKWCCRGSGPGKGTPRCNHQLKELIKTIIGAGGGDG